MRPCLKKFGQGGRRPPTSVLTRGFGRGLGDHADLALGHGHDDVAAAEELEDGAGDFARRGTEVLNVDPGFYADDDGPVAELHRADDRGGIGEDARVVTKNFVD